MLMIKNQPSIAAGWVSYRSHVMHPQAPAVQVSECYLAFWAGAAVLFEAIMKSLDPGEEPTEADLARFDNIAKEIHNFSKTFDAEVLKRSQTHGQQ